MSVDSRSLDRYRWVLLLIAGTTSSCAPSQDLGISRAGRAAIADTVTQATHAFAATYSRLDGRLLLPFFRADSEFAASTARLLSTMRAGDDTTQHPSPACAQVRS